MRFHRCAAMKHDPHVCEPNNDGTVCYYCGAPAATAGGLGMRTAMVRYVVPVYVTVDLDAEPNDDGWYPDDAIVEVLLGVDSIAPAGTEYAILLASSAHIDNPSTDEERERAVHIAESAVWPSW